MLPESPETQSRAFDIASCIRQADEYYQAAKQVGLATEPLLQFYGAQSLAKACILANDVTVTLNKLNYHGLSSRVSMVTEQEATILRTYSSNEGVWEVESEFGITNDGVFPFLCKVSGDTVPIKGQIVKFKDLIRILPDMSETYQRHYGEPSYCFYLYGDPVDEYNRTGLVRINVNSYCDFELFKCVYSEFSDGYEFKAHKDSNYGFQSLQKTGTFPESIKIIKGTVAGDYLVKPHAIGIYTTISVQFAALFILSNIVRYKPSFWMQTIEGGKTGSAAVVDAFLHYSKRRYSNDALELICGETFTFGTPGYLV